jgi:hypothetical protein
MRTALPIAAIPFVVAASPAPSASPSSGPADVVVLPTARGSWLATVTFTGGKISRYEAFAVASDGRASAPHQGTPTVLDDTALARVASAVASSNDSNLRVPRESTCCDRVITRVTLERRAAHARSITSIAQTAQSGTPLPDDADRIVGVGLRRESESDTDTVIVIGAATAAPSRGTLTAMSRKHVPFGLFLALTIAGCASPTSHAASPGMFGEVDLSSGGRWYLIDIDGDRASVLDGIDAIRAARDRITFKPDPRGAGIVAHGPVGRA